MKREDRHTSAKGIEENIEDGEARRDFLKKLTYVAPIMITFQMDDAEVSDDDDARAQRCASRASGHRRAVRRRARRETMTTRRSGDDGERDWPRA